MAATPPSPSTSPWSGRESWRAWRSPLGGWGRGSILSGWMDQCWDFVIVVFHGIHTLHHCKCTLIIIFIKTTTENEKIVYNRNRIPIQVTLKMVTAFMPPSLNITNSLSQPKGRMQESHGYNLSLYQVIQIVSMALQRRTEIEYWTKWPTRCRLPPRVTPWLHIFRFMNMRKSIAVLPLFLMFMNLQKWNCHIELFTKLAYNEIRRKYVRNRWYLIVIWI